MESCWLVGRKRFDGVYSWRCCQTKRDRPPDTHTKTKYRQPLDPNPSSHSAGTPLFSLLTGRKLWRRKNLLTILFITLAPRGFGRNSVCLRTSWWCRRSSLVTHTHKSKRIGDAVVVSPEISSGLPLPDKNRYPQPGSRPEKYATPATKGVLYGDL